jgi:hypothetical protein
VTARNEGQSSQLNRAVCHFPLSSPFVKALPIKGLEPDDRGQDFHGRSATKAVSCRRVGDRRPRFIGAGVQIAGRTAGAVGPQSGCRFHQRDDAADIRPRAAAYLFHWRLCRCELCPRAIRPPCIRQPARFTRSGSTNRHGRARNLAAGLNGPMAAASSRCLPCQIVLPISNAAHELGANLPPVQSPTSPGLPNAIRIRERMTRSLSRSSGRDRWRN